jgi:hypothetical protein
MGTIYCMIVKRTDGKFARAFGKSFGDEDYLGAEVMVACPDQAAAEAGLQIHIKKDYPVEIFDDLQSAWKYEDFIEFVFVWQDDKWFCGRSKRGPESLYEMTRENQPLNSYADQMTAEEDRRRQEEFWCDIDAEAPPMTLKESYRIFLTTKLVYEQDAIKSVDDISDRHHVDQKMKKLRMVITTMDDCDPDLIAKAETFLDTPEKNRANAEVLYRLLNRFDFQAPCTAETFFRELTRRLEKHADDPPTDDDDGFALLRKSMGL